MGDKATARATMMKVGVPTVPGSDGIIDTVDEAVSVAEEMGFTRVFPSLAVPERA